MKHVLNLRPKLEYLPFCLILHSSCSFPPKMLGAAVHFYRRFRRSPRLPPFSFPTQVFSSASPRDVPFRSSTLHLFIGWASSSFSHLQMAQSTGHEETNRIWISGRGWLLTLLSSSKELGVISRGVKAKITRESGMNWLQ